MNETFSLRLSLQECARMLDTPGTDLAPVRASIQQWVEAPRTYELINTLNQMWVQQNFTERALSRYIYYKINGIGKDRLFPYQILEETGEICNKGGLVKIHRMSWELTVIDDQNGHNYEPGYYMEDQPGYIVNMPVVMGVDNERNCYNLSRILTLFQKQAFSDTETKSQLKTRTRLAVIIGANRFRSIYKPRNIPFKQLQVIFKEPFPFEIFGFFWKPVWQCKEYEPSGLTPMKAARSFFSVLHKIDPICAEEIRSEIEEPSSGINERVPYQDIRETIKNSIYTRQAVTRLRAYHTPRLLYLAVMDPDCIQLRNDGRGLFSHYNRIIKEGVENNDQAPSIMSTGYKAAADATPLMELIIRLDQNARAIMFKYFPGAPYLPEPNLMLQIQPLADTVYESFKGKPGNGLESLHIVKDVITKRQLNKRVAIVFQRMGAIPTAIPRRFYNDVSLSRQPLFYEMIGKKQILQVLRGKDCQSHIFPLQGWAYNIAHELSVTRSPTLNSTLTKALNVFDPISLAYEYIEGRYSADDHFYPMMDMYERYRQIILRIYERIKLETSVRAMSANEVQQVVNQELNHALLLITELQPDQKVKLYELCHRKITLLLTAYNTFTELRVPLNETYRIISMAADVGFSIFRTLRFNRPINNW